MPNYRFFLPAALLFFGLLLTTACTYTQKIQDGNMAIERKQYAVAIPLLSKEYKRAKTRREKNKLAYQLGLAYRETSKEEEAATWFKRAYDDGFGTQALAEYAQSLKRLERYEEALDTYIELGQEIGSPYEYRNEVKGIEAAQQWAASDRKEFTVTESDFNSAGADYAPTPFTKGRLVFASDRPGTTGDEEYNWTGRAFADFFVADADGGSAQPFSAVINSDDNEGSMTFAADYSEVIFTRCSSSEKRGDAFCRLYSSRSEDGGDSWTTARQLLFQKPGINYLHPTLSANGQRLIFSSEQEEGWGGYDLYEITRIADGEWGEPVLMNRSLNTQGDEQFPYLDADTLYFASDGHIGLGGLDVFRSFPMPGGRWSPPANLRQPINSGADDFGYVVDRTPVAGDPDLLQRGYFSSERPGGRGSDDIYRYERRRLPPPPPRVDTTPIVYRDVLDIFAVEPIYEESGNPNSRVLGRRPLPGAIISVNVGGKSRDLPVNEEGQLSIILNEEADYDFVASADGYLKDEDRFSSRGLARDPDNPTQRYELEMELTPIITDREIVLQNIYYDLDQSFIREDAQPTLNRLADLLKLNPDIRIEMGSHTDCRATDRYNEDLSGRRAQAAVDYLIQRGIAAERLSARGYGESQPVTDCLCTRCTEVEHQRNRRTSFRIL